MERSLYLTATYRQRYCIVFFNTGWLFTPRSHHTDSFVCLWHTMHEWRRVVCVQDIIGSSCCRSSLAPVFTLGSCSCTLVRTAGSVWRRYGSFFSPVEIDLPQFLVRSPLRMNAACSQRKVVRSRMRVHRSCGEIEPGDIPPRSLLARFMVHFPAERVDLSVRLATADTITAQTQNNHRPYMTAG